jgi:hypothetical protein
MPMYGYLLPQVIKKRLGKVEKFWTPINQTPIVAKMKEQKMNKILAGILAVSMTAGLVSAQEQTNVLSRNAVGYIKRAIPANSLELLTVPFESLAEDANTIESVFGGLDNGAQVTVWDVDTQTYRTFQKAKGSWGNAGTNIVARGEGMFVRAPLAASQELIVMGEVPGVEAPTNNQTVLPGFNLLGSGYPVSVSWTGTTLSAQLPNGSQVSLWDGSEYILIQKAKGSWGQSGDSLVIEPGSGFFVRVVDGGDPIEWSETKPYEWP